MQVRVVYAYGDGCNLLFESFRLPCGEKEGIQQPFKVAGAGALDAGKVEDYGFTFGRGGFLDEFSDLLGVRPTGDGTGEPRVRRTQIGDANCKHASIFIYLDK